MTMAVRRCALAVTVAWLVTVAAQAQPGAPAGTALENDYVRVSRNAAPCAKAAAGTCEDRVILAMADLTLTTDGKARQMKRAEVAVFSAGQSYTLPSGAAYFEIAIKPGHPAVKAPAERIAAPKNLPLYKGKTFFIYEEILPVGETRTRHSHAQRVEIRINTGPMLRQQVWRDGGVVHTEPGIVNWREPVIHIVHNIGDMPLRNFILEFIPQ
jgi:hypothetical protein